MIKNGARPPLVKGFPLVGSAMPLLNDPHRFVARAYKDLGPVFRFRAAHRSYVVLAGVEANRFVSGQGKDCFGVDSFWGKAGEYMGCPHMMIAVDGEMHRYQRNAMAPLMSHNAFKNRLEDLANPAIDLAIALKKERSTKVSPWLRQMVSNQIGFNLQGYKTSYRSVQWMIYYFGSVMNVYGLRKWPEIMLRTPKFLYAKRVTQNHTRYILNRARTRTESEKALNPLYLDVMIPLLEQRPDWFTEGDIAIHALLPFVAALDTVASTLGFILHRLLDSSELMAIVKDEIDLAFKDGVPSVESLRNMENLNGLVKETLRLQPTAFGITRSAAKDFTFKGAKINKGDDVLVYTTADHLNPEYFPNPEAFDIYRYRGSRMEHKQPAYAPFGKGPHNCLGASLAELLLPLNLGIILSNLQLEAACNLKKVRTIYNPAPSLDESFKVKARY